MIEKDALNCWRREGSSKGVYVKLVSLANVEEAVNPSVRGSMTPFKRPLVLSGNTR